MVFCLKMRNKFSMMAYVIDRRVTETEMVEPLKEKIGPECGLGHYFFRDHSLLMNFEK